MIEPLRVACIGMGWWSDVLADAIQRMDRMQNLCALDVQPQSLVGDRQVEELLAMNERVAAFVEMHTHRAPADRAATV